MTPNCTSAAAAAWFAFCARSTTWGRAQQAKRFRISTSCTATRRTQHLKIAPSSSDIAAQPTRLIELRGGIGAVPGVTLAGVHAGIKKRKPDLALIVFEGDQNAVSVITT